MIVAPELNMLIASLAGAGITAATRANDVLGDVAEHIEATAKTFVPIREGDLRDSIGVDRDKLEAVIGPSLYYGRFVENGTAKMSPQAFMGPALDRHSHELEAGLLGVIDL